MASTDRTDTNLPNKLKICCAHTNLNDRNELLVAVRQPFVASNVPVLLEAINAKRQAPTGKDAFQFSIEIWSKNQVLVWDLASKLLYYWSHVTGSQIHDVQTGLHISIFGEHIKDFRIWQLK